MKKIFPLLMIVLSSTIITHGATDLKNHTGDNKNFDAFQHQNTIEMELENNPIDKKYNEYISKLTATDEIQKEQNQYYEAWIYDINQTIPIICEYLSEGDKKVFLEYCQYWEEYQEAKFNWEKSQYYNNGSINRILVTDYRAEEAKQFALNLKRYLYTYIASIEFFNNGYID